jgi:excisionase family DNA binding protein
MKMLISIAEFQEITGVSRSTVYRLIERGDISCVHIGRSVRLHRDDVNVWLEKLSAAEAMCRAS